MISRMNGRMNIAMWQGVQGARIPQPLVQPSTYFSGDPTEEAYELVRFLL